MRECKHAIFFNLLCFYLTNMLCENRKYCASSPVSPSMQSCSLTWQTSMRISFNVRQQLCKCPSNISDHENCKFCTTQLSCKNLVESEQIFN